jgi:ParB family chromosome partitioning protein
MTATTGSLVELDPTSIVKNPNNPRRYFNEERLDQLRTSLQEVGVLVPLIVYREPGADTFVLMDGERRWRCALDLGLDRVPVNIIDTPTDLDNLLRMFNIHNVREDWPLISVALSLRDVMALSGETGEKRLAEITGLTRSAVRRAKRLLTMPDSELDLIQAEAHLDRNEQVHREDLYLEIEAAESVLRGALPEVAERFPRDEIIRRFANKAETGNLRAVTDFRFVSKLVKAADEAVVDRDVVIRATTDLITDVTASPRDVFEAVAAAGYRQQGLQRKTELLVQDLETYGDALPLSAGLRSRLEELRDVLGRLLDSRS